MPTLTVGRHERSDVELYYEDHGSGDPVVLIHGWPLSGRSWEAQVPALIDAGHRVVTYDRRGFGRSSQPWGGYDYDTLAADLHALIEHLDLDGATLAGFSMGGGEVARYIGRYGTGRLARAVFIAAITPALGVGADNPDGGLDEGTVAQLQAGVRGDRMGFLDGFMRNFFGVDGDLKVSEHQLRDALEIARWGSPRGQHDCIASWATDFRADLGRCDVPTLVIHGDADAIVPFAVSGRRMAEAVPGSRLVVIEGGPHGILVSHAAEVNRALREFLAG